MQKQHLTAKTKKAAEDLVSVFNNWLLNEKVGAPAPIWIDINVLMLELERDGHVSSAAINTFAVSPTADIQTS